MKWELTLFTCQGDGNVVQKDIKEDGDTTECQREESKATSSIGNQGPTLLPFYQIDFLLEVPKSGSCANQVIQSQITSPGDEYNGCLFYTLLLVTSIAKWKDE